MRKKSKGLVDKLYSSYNVIAWNPQRYFILSSNKKLIIGPCGVISIIDPNVGKFKLIFKWIISFCIMLFINDISFNFIVQ